MNALKPILPETEAAAKAALLCHLLTTGQITRTTAIVLELCIAKQANRADVVTVDDQIHCFEIKTKRDNLDRLDRQLASYLAVADRVSVVAAGKHVNAILSRVPSNVGVMEMLEHNGQIEIRSVRPASETKCWSSASALDLLPATEIRARLVSTDTKSTRNELVQRALSLSDDRIRHAVVRFLRDRYLPTTRVFLRSLRQKPVKMNHLAALRIWRREEKVESFPDVIETIQNYCGDQATYEYVGLSFGPVPTDVQQSLASNQPIAPRPDQYLHR